jgi:hypothetical protein
MTFKNFLFAFSLTLTLFFTSILHSCGKQGETKKEEEPFLVRELLQAEYESGENICKALRDKRNIFEVSPDRSFSGNFKIGFKDCNQSESRTSVINLSLRVPIDRGEARWEGPRRSKYFSKIITDKSEGFSIICTKIFSGERVETSITRGNLRYHFQLIPDATFGQIRVSTLLKESNQEILKDRDSFKIQLVAGKLRGHIIERQRERACSGNGSSLISQKRL